MNRQGSWHNFTLTSWQWEQTEQTLHKMGQAHCSTYSKYSKWQLSQRSRSASSLLFFFFFLVVPLVKSNNCRYVFHGYHYRSVSKVRLIIFLSDPFFFKWRYQWSVLKSEFIRWLRTQLRGSPSLKMFFKSSLITSWFSSHLLYNLLKPYTVCMMFPLWTVGPSM